MTYHARQTVIYSITYDPYGRLLAQTGSSGTTYGFTGEQEDAATGLMYLRARYYNPALKESSSPATRSPAHRFTGLTAWLQLCSQ
ncbi:MAG: RHS repeat-associated core domain-containing protein [Chloroflexota bacterium]